MHSYDLPDESHPPARPEWVPAQPPMPSGAAVLNNRLITALEGLPQMRDQWINAQALNAAVGHASAWMARGSDPWDTDDVLRVARVYRKFITGETS